MKRASSTKQAEDLNDLPNRAISFAALVTLHQNGNALGGTLPQLENRELSAMLAKVQRHVQVAGRAVQGGEHKSYLAAMLSAVIDNMEQRLPEWERGCDAFEVLIDQVCVQLARGERGQERACLLLFVPPACANHGQRREIARIQGGFRGNSLPA